MFQSDGDVLARTGLSFGLEMERLPLSALDRAARGEVVVLTGDTEDRVRALVRLDNFVDAYLFVGRFVDARVLSYMDRTRAAIDEYRTLELRRADIQVIFAVIFGVVALLLLLAAVWVGLTFADSLATPIAHLIRAADRVRRRRSDGAGAGDRGGQRGRQPVARLQPDDRSAGQPARRADQRQQPARPAAPVHRGGDRRRVVRRHRPRRARPDHLAESLGGRRSSATSRTA